MAVKRQKNKAVKSKQRATRSSVVTRRTKIVTPAPAPALVAAPPVPPPTTEGDTTIGSLVEHVIFIPAVPEMLSPLIEIVPLQLLAYYIAVRRGCDVDQPRNLAKSVTVE